MTDPGSGWASPSGPTQDGADEPAAWQAPTYPPAYPPAYGNEPPPAAAPPPPQYSGWGPAWMAQPGVVPLRPLGLGELLDGAVKIIRRYPKPTLALSAVLTTIVTLIDVLIIAGRGPLSSNTEATGSEILADSASGLPAQVVSGLVGLVLTGAMVTVVSRAVLGQQATLRDAWDATRPRLWALLGVAFLSTATWVVPLALVVLLGVVASPGFFVLMIGVVPLAVWAYVTFSLAPGALILERCGVVTSLKRSRALTRTGWWRVLGILLLTSLLVGIVAAIVVFPVAIATGVLSFDATEIGVGVLIANSVASGLAQVLVAPYAAGMRALLYIDQRMRNEGLDVALQAAAATRTQ